MEDFKSRSIHLLVQGVPFTTVFFKGTLLLQKMSDFKNFFTGKSAMN